MTDYTRTAIRSLSIKGFRSIRSLELENIPDLVVLHGPNGSGKSNLLLAAELVIRAATLPGELPVSKKTATKLSLANADKLLKLRPDDFHIGLAPKKIQIAVTIELGRRTDADLGHSTSLSTNHLLLNLIAEQIGDTEIRYWFAQANFADGLSLGIDQTPAAQQLRNELAEAQASEAAHNANAFRFEQELEDRSEELDFRAGLRAQIISHMHSSRTAAFKAASQARELQDKLGPASFVAERMRRTVLPKLLQISPAYRVPGSEADPETALFHAFLSENQKERQATERLSRRLGKAKLFGPKGDSAENVRLIPVESGTYKEKQVRISHPTGGELPLRNLGSGEQQVIFMLAQRVITPFPIAFLEEPEAHLHTSLMGPFAQVLLDSVQGDGGVPDVDQLWIATHHHHFALALEYFDVQLVDGATQVTRLPRAKAAQHFFEPGPIWEALRQLASSAKQREAVVFRAADGAPVTAGQILDSIEKDPMQQVAKDYANAVTEAMVLAMRQRAEKATGPKE